VSATLQVDSFKLSFEADHEWDFISHFHPAYILSFNGTIRFFLLRPVPKLTAARKYIISPIEARLLSQIVAIERDSFRNPYSPEYLRLLTQWCSELFLTAVSDSNVLGYVVAAANEKHCHIISLAVRPAYRRLGIGRDLLETLMERLRSIGVVEVTLEVREDNPIAAALYEKLGFRPSQKIDRYYEDGCTAIIFEKSLT
jgi:ribosomal-protein-alanine N-acetyltransferase